TLKIGDVIFTGTPSGVAKVAPNDVLTGYVEEEEFFKIKIK
ncbi:MAG: 2-keto-4-pentenoate hydratase/2-oxohepta-3-ene-1,7-dioic acid hydratase in catechol pathway, partial [Patiriisocius sp.]